MNKIANYGVSTRTYTMTTEDFVAIATGFTAHDLSQIRYHADLEEYFSPVDASEVLGHPYYAGPGRGAGAYCDILAFELSLSADGMTITLIEQYYSKLSYGEAKPYALYVPDDVQLNIDDAMKEIYASLDIDFEDDEDA